MRNSHHRPLEAGGCLAMHPRLLATQGLGRLKSTPPSPVHRVLTAIVSIVHQKHTVEHQLQRIFLPEGEDVHSCMPSPGLGCGTLNPEQTV